jgi:hypothetical protein
LTWRERASNHSSYYFNHNWLAPLRNPEGPAHVGHAPECRGCDPSYDLSGHSHRHDALGTLRAPAAAEHPARAPLDEQSRPRGAERGWGLFNTIDAPLWVAITVSVLLLDPAIYLQHVLFHAVPGL